MPEIMPDRTSGNISGSQTDYSRNYDEQLFHAIVRFFVNGDKSPGFQMHIRTPDSYVTNIRNTPGTNLSKSDTLVAILPHSGLGKPEKQLD